MLGSFGDANLNATGGCSNPGASQPSQTPPAPGLAAHVVERIARGVEHLLRAFDYAADLDCSPWEFAVRLDELRAEGLESGDLRWLVRKGYAEHAVEVTLPGEDGRSFHRSRGLTLRRQTCFVLTPVGAAFARQLADSAPTVTELRVHPSAATASTPAHKPHWDPDMQELRYNGQLVKQFKVPAPNQEMILAAFEEEGWPPRIDDPLPPQFQLDCKRRLHDTINSLNRNHKSGCIRFMGDGTGEGIRWTRIDRQETAE